MLGFPGLDVVDGEQEVRVGRGLLGEVEHVDRADELLDGERVGRAVGIVLAGYPVDRRVEMRAGMLAELQPVPGPPGTVLVVGGDGVDLDLRRVDRELRRQLDQRRVGTEHGGEVHHLDAAGKKLAGEFAEKFLRVHVVPLDRWRLAALSALNMLLDENICICNYL